MSDSQQVHIPTIPDFLGAAPWKHALFTTYALSLSYFESELLRPLLRGGCDDIWVIADAEGYRSSLLERRSMRVGQEYRLVPAAMPNGIQHAKSVYLSSEDEDLLLVGSGNITFGGHGKNAEVFEALAPNGAAQAFEDFAAFLESFRSRPDVRLGTYDWIDEFVARARRAASRGENASPPIRLIHSMDAPVVSQIPNFVGELGPCRGAVVMSPYHDPDAEAVQRLVEMVKAPQCAVAVAPKRKTPFPFSETSSWGCQIRPVSLAEPEKRFIHAKWFEFEFAERRLLLTGSINATRKALTTTDNAELGVLRNLPIAPAPIAWENAPEPAFEASARFPSGLGTKEIVYATFDRSDAHSLRGRLISSQEAAGAWQLRLIQADGETFSCEADLDVEGGFAITNAALELFSNYSAVQIALTRDEREARGWVHNDMLLSVGIRRRLTAGAMSRLMRREGTDDDLQALLDYLSVNAEQHLRLFDAPVIKSEEDGEDFSAAVTVQIDELAPSREPPITAETDADGGRARDDQFEVAMLRLRRVLLGQGRTRAQPMVSQNDEMLAEEDLDEQGQKTLEEQRRQLGLDDFEHAIGAMIEDAGERQEIVNRLLVLLLEVGMWMRLARLGDPEGAHDFLSTWFFRACRQGYYEADRVTALQQHVITAAPILYLLAHEGANRQVLGIALHDSLERFCRGSVDRDQAVEQLVPDSHAGFGALLFDEDDLPNLESILQEILATKTRRQQLDDALARAGSGLPRPEESEVFSSELGNVLWEKLQSDDWQKRVRRGPSSAAACAFCYLRFPPDEANQMRRQRFARCVHCSRFTVDINP